MAKVENNRWDWNEDGTLSGTGTTDYVAVDEVEWTGESYEFDLTRVYKQISTGALFYATDTGCSCPIPFESTEDTDLTPIRRMQDWYDHVTDRTVQDAPDEDGYQYPRPTPASSIDKAHRVTQQVMGLLKNDSGTGRVWEYKSTDLY